jgi:hypothetical protein
VVRIRVRVKVRVRVRHVHEMHANMPGGRVISCRTSQITLELGLGLRLHAWRGGNLLPHLTDHVRVRVGVKVTCLVGGQSPAAPHRPRVLRQDHQPSQRQARMLRPAVRWVAESMVGVPECMINADRQRRHSYVRKHRQVRKTTDTQKIQIESHTSNAVATYPSSVV